MSKLFPAVSWLKGASIYEVNIRQYTAEGTFKSFQQHLARLKDMGVDILWLMPVTPISVEKRQSVLGSYYACADYCKINPEFGNEDSFKDLVQSAHALGMKIILDWVANHTGWDHVWTQTHPDWYLRDAWGNLVEEHGWNDVVDLNYDNLEMRAAMIESMKLWVRDFDIDGFRCDMAHLVPLDFWKDARTQCDQIKPLLWLGECELQPYEEVFDITYSWWLMHESECYVKGNASLDNVRNVLKHYREDLGYRLFFTSNHDENSWDGTEYEKYGEAAKAVAVFTCIWENAIPLVYTGQEIPNYRRLRFFEKDALEWPAHPALHQFYKTILGLHHSRVITEGETVWIDLGPQRLIAVLRHLDNSTVLAVLNLSSSGGVRFTLEHKWLHGIFKNLFTGFNYIFSGKESFEVDAYGYLLFTSEIELTLD